MNMPIFSIIIPTYNSETTLQTTLDSIVMQSYRSLEVVIIDGLSSDSTVKIVENNLSKDQRIRFVSEKDKGIYDAMNKGVAMAKGEWIYFLGSDDHLINNNVLMSVFSEIRNGEFDFVYGNIYSLAYRRVYDGKFDMDKILKKNISHQSIFYNRNIFSKVGLFNLAYKTHADWDFNIRCYINESIKKNFINLVIAEFAIGGASAAVDIPFFRDSLIPAKLRYLDNYSSYYFRKIGNYDDWWRLIRNAEIRNQEQMNLYLGKKGMYAYIKNMVKWQSWVPLSVLRKGIISKTLMFGNYIYNLLFVSNK